MVNEAPALKRVPGKHLVEAVHGVRPELGTDSKFQQKPPVMIFTFAKTRAVGSGCGRPFWPRLAGDVGTAVPCPV